MLRTLSAASSNFARRGAVVLLTLFSSRAAVAQQETSPAISSGPTSEETLSVEQSEPPSLPEPVEAEAQPVVLITSVGTALSPASLERMLGPALKSSFHLRFSSANRFNVEELFRIRTGSSARIHVWVDTTVSRSTRVFFANRDGTRYLVRDLERSNPLNEMDREAIAQAIEWSLQALSEGTAGMTREEAEALLAAPSEEEDASSESEQEKLVLVSPWRRRFTGWLPEVAFLHDWTPVSGELPAAQGPVLRVGADRLSEHGQFGVSASVHYQYPQRHAADGVALEIQTVGARVDVRYLATGLVEGSGIGFRAGAGFDAMFASPEALDGERFEAAESTSYLVPLIAGGFVWQVHVESSVRLEMSLGVQIDLANFQYDVVTADGTLALVSPWPVRPSVSVGVALF